LTKLDAHEIADAEYDDAPELTEDLLDRSSGWQARVAADLRKAATKLA
jgi:hypothetical protein